MRLEVLSLETSSPSICQVRFSLVISQAKREMLMGVPGVQSSTQSVPDPTGSKNKTYFEREYDIVRIRDLGSIYESPNRVECVEAFAERQGSSVPSSSHLKIGGGHVENESLYQVSGYRRQILLRLTISGYVIHGLTNFDVLASFAYDDGKFNCGVLSAVGFAAYLHR
jgi:hypothetical protein